MKGINKSYPMGEEQLQVLFDVNFEVYKTYYDECPFSHHAACIFSNDGGKFYRLEMEGIELLTPDNE